MTDSRVTNPVDISPETVEQMAQWCEGANGKMPGALRPSAMLRELRTALTASGERTGALERTLKFYADGLHFSKGAEADWDSVSGEPENFQCNEHGDTVEDGGIAKAALEGRYVIDEDDDEKQANLFLKEIESP